MFDHLSTLMTLQYVKDKVMGEEHGFITMEMCHRVLTSKWMFSCFHTNLSFHLSFLMAAVFLHTVLCIQ